MNSRILIHILLCAWLLWAQAYPVRCNDGSCTTNVLVKGGLRLLDTYDTLKECKDLATSAKTEADAELMKHVQPPKDKDDKEQEAIKGEWTGWSTVYRCLPDDVHMPIDNIMLPK